MLILLPRYRRGTPRDILNLSTGELRRCTRKEIHSGIGSGTRCGVLTLLIRGWMSKLQWEGLRQVPVFRGRPPTPMVQHSFGSPKEAQESAEILRQELSIPDAPWETISEVAGGTHGYPEMAAEAGSKAAPVRRRP